LSELYDRASALRIGLGAMLAGGLRFPVEHPRWRFVFVNHALTNPFFVPAKYGSVDAGRLLGVTATWRGSRSSDVGEMVKAMKHAVDARVDGIAVSIIDATAFNATTALALEHDVPVVAYNADGGKSNTRLAYIGQDNYQSGLEMGARIAALVPEGLVCIFIATPNQQNIQPRGGGGPPPPPNPPGLGPLPASPQRRSLMYARYTSLTAPCAAGKGPASRPPGFV
jgi:ABC-type sugar transport system substrate-binding protein